MTISLRVQKCFSFALVFELIYFLTAFSICIDLPRKCVFHKKKNAKTSFHWKSMQIQNCFFRWICPLSRYHLAENRELLLWFLIFRKCSLREETVYLFFFGKCPVAEETIYLEPSQTIADRFAQLCVLLWWPSHCSVGRTGVQDNTLLEHASLDNLNLDCSAF